MKLTLKEIVMQEDLKEKWIKTQPLLRDIYPEYGEKTKIHATPDVKGFADSLLYFQNWLNADFEKNIQEAEATHEESLKAMIEELHDWLVENNHIAAECDRCVNRSEVMMKYEKTNKY